MNFLKYLTFILCLLAPNALAQSELKPAATLSGHLEQPSWLAINPSGDQLAFVAGASVYLYDLHARKFEASWQVQEGVRNIAFSPDGARLVTAQEEKVTVWDVETLEPVRLFDKHQASVTRASFWRNANTVLSLDYDELLIAWDVSTGEMLWHMTLPTYAASSFVLSPDENYLAVGGDEAHVIDLENRRVVHEVSTGRVFNEDEQKAYPVGFSGEHFLTEDLHHGIHVWNLKTGELETTLSPSVEELDEALITPQGDLLSVDDAGWLLRTSLSDQTTDRLFQLDEPGFSLRIAADPAGQTLIYTTDEQIKIVDLTTGATFSFGVPSSTVDAVAFSRQGSQMVTASGSTLVFWDTEERIPTLEVNLLQGPDVQSLLYRKIGGTYYVLAQSRYGVDAVDVTTGAVYPYLLELAPQVGSLDGGRERDVLAVGMGTQAVLWDSSTGQVTHEFKVQDTSGEDKVSALMNSLLGHWEVRLSPDGSHLLTLGKIEGRSTLSLWDREAETVVQSLVPLDDTFEENGYNPERPHWKDRFTDARFLGGGAQVAASMWRSGVRLYDTALGRDLWVYPDVSVVSLAVSPDESTIAALQQDGKVVLLDSQTGDVRAHLDGHPHASTLAFSPDTLYLDPYLVVGSGTADAPGTLTLYEVPTTLQLGDR